jgi:hypothetical protein
VSKLIRRLVLAGSCVAMASALPATLLSESRTGPTPCESTCISRWNSCIAAGNPETLCDRSYETCMAKCALSGA